MSPHEPSNPVVSRLVAARRLPLARLRSDPPVHVQARRPDGPHRRASHGTARCPTRKILLAARWPAAAAGRHTGDGRQHPDRRSAPVACLVHAAASCRWVAAAGR